MDRMGLPRFTGREGWVFEDGYKERGEKWVTETSRRVKSVQLKPGGIHIIIYLQLVTHKGWDFRDDC